MTHAAPTTNDELGELRRDFDRLKTDLRDIRATLMDVAGDFVRTAKAGATGAKARVDESVRAAGAKGKESVEAIEQQVAAHPLMSLAAAMAVGMVLGFGLTRRG